jgi:hypothetical protein
MTSEASEGETIASSTIRPSKRFPFEGNELPLEFERCILIKSLGLKDFEDYHTEISFSFSERRHPTNNVDVGLMVMEEVVLKLSQFFSISSFRL